MTNDLEKAPSAKAPIAVPRPPSYPVRAEHRAWAVEQLASVAANLLDLLKDRGEERFLDAMKECLRGGNLRIAVALREAAENGDHVCDKVLREIAAELQTVTTQRRELAPGHFQIIAYAQSALTRAPVKRKPGRYDPYDAWMRDIAICCLVKIASAWLGVKPVRNRASHRPSGISLTVEALARHRINLTEAAVQKKIWFGPPGEVVRGSVNIDFTIRHSEGLQVRGIFTES